MAPTTCTKKTNTKTAPTPPPSETVTQHNTSVTMTTTDITIFGLITTTTRQKNTFSTVATAKTPPVTITNTIQSAPLNIFRFRHTLFLLVFLSKSTSHTENSDIYTDYAA